MSANGTATTAEMVDVSMLAPEDRRLVRHFVAWILAVSHKDVAGSRFEAVAGEGHPKVMHVNRTTPRDRF